MQFGAIFSKPDVRDYKMKLVMGGVDLPEEYECPDMPEVKNQGSICSCVAHALATIVEWHSRRQGDSPEEMSTAFIYGNRLNSVWTGEGMVTRDAVDVVKKCGTCEKRYLPKNIETPEAIDYFKKNYYELSDKAFKYRFTAYTKVNDIETMKASLVKYGPMAIGMDWWRDITFSPDMVMQTSQKGDAGGHCMVLYGYNKTGWLVQNSWGKGWGNKGGRLVIPYNVKIREVYQIIDEYSEAEQKARIKALEDSNNAYREEVANLNREIAKLNQTLTELKRYQNLSEEQEKQITELLKSLDEHEAKTSELLEKIKEQNAEIEILRSEILEVKKPFKSKFGQFFAKIINAIISVFYEIFKR